MRLEHSYGRVVHHQHHRRRSACPGNLLDRLSRLGQSLTPAPVLLCHGETEDSGVAERRYTIARKFSLAVDLLSRRFYHGRRSPSKDPRDRTCTGLPLPCGRMNDSRPPRLLAASAAMLPTRVHGVKESDNPWKSGNPDRHVRRRCGRSAWRRAGSLLAERMQKEGCI